MRRRYGFTLIELLVVIAIIAILAAILFPVFARARDKARGISCLSNIKSIMMAGQMYGQDFDEQLHRIRSWNAVLPPGKWALGSQDMLDPYVKNKGVWKCPSDSIARDDCGGNPGQPISYTWTHYQAGFDDGTSGGWTATFGVHAYYVGERSKTLSSLGAPGDTASLVELWTTASYDAGFPYWRWDVRNFADPGWPEAPNTFSFTWCGASPGAARMTVGSHNGMTNLGFVDGHAKAVRRQTFMPWPWTPAAINQRRAAGQSNRNLLHWDAQYK